jgi:adenylylsulfate kinase
MSMVTSRLIDAQPCSQRQASGRLRPESGGVLWLTGLRGAGKSTLARLVGERLSQIGAEIEVLDGDDMRRCLSKGLGFTREDRDENIRRIGYVAATLAAHSVWAIVAAISPYRTARRDARALAVARRAPFLEVYVRCPLVRARRGEIECFTGVSDPYEEPLAPDLIVDTSVISADECARAILAL